MRGLGRPLRAPRCDLKRCSTAHRPRASRSARSAAACSAPAAGGCMVDVQWVCRADWEESDQLQARCVCNAWQHSARRRRRRRRGCCRPPPASVCFKISNTLHGFNPKLAQASSKAAASFWRAGATRSAAATNCCRHANGGRGELHCGGMPARPCWASANLHTPGWHGIPVLLAHCGMCGGMRRPVRGPHRRRPLSHTAG